MDFSNETYLIAQIIGLVGYGFYMSAPLFRSRRQILGIELIGCIFLCLHWHFMDVTVLVWANVIWVYMILASMLKDYHRQSADILISFAYLFVFINSYVHWQGTWIDYTAFPGILLAITCRYYTDLLKFRMIACAGGCCSTICSVFAMSAAAVIFNLLFSFGHARRIKELLGKDPMPSGIIAAPALQPATIKIRAQHR